jgi:hypothetical protein
MLNPLQEEQVFVFVGQEHEMWSIRHAPHPQFWCWSLCLNIDSDILDGAARARLTMVAAR